MTFLDKLRNIAGDSLTHYYELDGTNKTNDLVGSVNGKVHGRVHFRDDGAHFDDGKSWIELPDSPDFSAGPTKELTVLAFVEVKDWTRASHNGEYVHYMGKGHSHAHEWTCRIYMDGGGGEASARRRRTSFYAFNPSGGLGAGSYVQDAEASKHERMMTGVIYAKGRGSHPGVTRQYQNGVKKDEDQLSGYNITPEHTNTSVGIGSRGDNTGFLVGRIRRVAFFNKALSDDQIKHIYAARAEANAGAVSAPQEHASAGNDEVVIGGAKHAIDGVNVERKANQLIAYTAAGWDADSTKTNEFGTEVVVAPSGKVVQVRKGAGDTPVADKGVVLSGHGTAREWLNDHATDGVQVALPEALLPKPPEPKPPVHPNPPTRVETPSTARPDEANALRAQAAELRKTADALDVIATHLGG